MTDDENMLMLLAGIVSLAEKLRHAAESGARLASLIGGSDWYYLQKRIDECKEFDRRAP